MGKSLSIEHRKKISEGVKEAHKRNPWNKKNVEKRIKNMWKEWEKETLRELYSNASEKELLSRLPHRSWGAIGQQARKLGLKRPNSGIFTSERLKELWKDKRYRSKVLPSRRNIELRKRSAERLKRKMDDPEFLKKSFMSLLKRPTSPEMKFIELIEKYNLPYRYVGNGQIWIARKNPDFIHLHEKRAIEIFGSYWHDKTLNPHVKDEETSEFITDHYRKHGWNCVILWDHELDNGNHILNKLDLK